MRVNKYNRLIFLFFSFLILNSSFLIATVRYVSHTGNSTPPYTSWTTAADSIQKCINISVFGDTIFVANGVYEEQVIMIPGLSLIGSGMDSCVIDTRSFIQPLLFASVRVYDNCKFEGFKVIVSNDRNSIAIISDNATAIVEFNKLQNAHTAVSLIQSNSTIQNNILQNFEIGLSLSNSESDIRYNQITNVKRGIIIDAFSGDYYPIIAKNIIRCDIQGVLVQFNSRPTIRNNIIFLNGDGADGYNGGGSDTAWVYNNLVVAPNGLDFLDGFKNTTVPTIEYNNFVIGEVETGITVWNFNHIKNNVLLKGYEGIYQGGSGNDIIIEYNLAWNNNYNYRNFAPDSTNLSVDPMVVSEDSLDFHLQMYSPLIDAGDPNILDIDGSRSDIGLFGGPYGEKYTYRDLAPKPPSNLTAEYDSGLVYLRWNSNTEADFYRYRVYRDTVPNFIYDTTKIIATVADTFYYDDLPEKYMEKNYYYKLTAIDSAYHQSATSEEVQVIITGVPEGPPIVAEEYKLLNNYPNPFNPSTIIPYRLKEAGHVKLTVYNLLAEKVAVLVDEYQDKGYYEAVFQPNSHQIQRGKIGSGVEFPTGYNNDIATGIYIYELIISDSPWEIKFTGQGKMIFLK